MARWAAQPNMVRTRLGKHDVAGRQIVPCRAATAEARARHERRVVVLCRHDGRVGPHGSCRLKPDGGCSRSGSDGEAHLNEVVVTARRAGEEAVMMVRTPSAAPSGPPRMSCRHRLLLWTSPRVWPSPPPPHVPYYHHLPPPPHASLPPPPSPCAPHRCRLNGRRGKRQRKEIRRGDSRGKREGNRDGDGLGC